VRVVAFLLFAVLLSFRCALAESYDFSSVLQSWLDPSCIDFRIKGICIKHKHGHIKVGVKVSYYLPVALVEAPPSPYQTAIPPLKPVLKAAEPAVERMVQSLPVFSSLGYEFGGNIEGLEDTYYREVHIFSFPGIANPILQLLPMLCGRPYLPTFVWFSEADPLDWRLGLHDYLNGVKNLPAQAQKLADDLKKLSSVLSSPVTSLKNFASYLKNRVSGLLDSLRSQHFTQQDWKSVLEGIQKAADKTASSLPDGGWGSKKPHVGYVHDVSSTIAYHLMAVRALDLAFPLKPRWHEDKFQMVLPTKTGCYYIGDDRIKTETGKMVGGDTPVWVYWYHFECCVF
jgi:hypothetical protein